MRLISCYALLVAVALLSPASSAAEKTTTETIVELGRTENRVMEHLDQLANRIGPRLTSSDNLQNACQWAREAFASFGIDNARLERWGEFPVGFNRGPWSGRMVEPQQKPLEFGTNAWTAGTRGLVRGRAVLAPKDAETLESMRESLRGAWVFAPRAQRRGRGRRGGGTPAGVGRGAAPRGGRGAPPEGARGRNPRPPQAAGRFDRGASSTYEGTGIAGVVRPSRGELIITGGNYRISWENLPTTPSVTLLQKQWDSIVELLYAENEVTLEFDIRNYFKKGPIPLYNVIADIPGTAWPDQYVIVGGHIDSWDGATGTNDNGTGCATTLEAARLLMASGAQPRRTIRFMLWSGEEQGLLGSRAFVRANPELMPNISAVLVHDMGTNYLSGIKATKAIRDDFDQVFAPLLTLDPQMPFRVSDANGLRGGGSDHAPFLQGGVPAFFWEQSGDSSYRRVHHTQFDTYDGAIAEYQRHSAVVVAVAALGIANLDHLLSRENLAAPRAPPRRFLGVQLDGLRVVEVVDGAPAGTADIRPGDVIVRVDGTEVRDRTDLVGSINRGAPAKVITVRRDDEELELEVNLSGRR